MQSVNHLPNDVRLMINEWTQQEISLQAAGLPTFTLTGQNRAILITITGGLGGEPDSYEFNIRQRNNQNTRWGNSRPGGSFTGNSHTVTVFPTGAGDQNLRNGRRYQIQVRAVNSAGVSEYTNWQEATPSNA